MDTSSSRDSIVDVLVASWSSSAVAEGDLDIATDDRRRSLLAACSCAFCRSSDSSSDFYSGRFVNNTVSRTSPARRTRTNRSVSLLPSSDFNTFVLSSATSD